MKVLYFITEHGRIRRPEERGRRQGVPRSDRQGPLQTSSCPWSAPSSEGRSEMGVSRQVRQAAKSPGGTGTSAKACPPRRARLDEQRCEPQKTRGLRATSMVSSGFPLLAAWQAWRPWRLSTACAPCGPGPPLLLTARFSPSRLPDFSRARTANGRGRGSRMGALARRVGGHPGANGDSVGDSSSPETGDPSPCPSSIPAINRGAPICANSRSLLSEQFGIDKLLGQAPYDAWGRTSARRRSSARPGGAARSPGR